MLFSSQYLSDKENLKFNNIGEHIVENSVWDRIKDTATTIKP